MPVLYRGNLLRPVQTVDYEPVKVNAGDGRSLGSTIRATVRGTITPDVTNGAATPVADDAKLAAILAQQAAIRAIFAVDGGMFEVQGWDGSAPTKFNARVVSGPEFEDGPWYWTCGWQVVLEAAQVAGEAVDNQWVEDPSESWSFQEGERPKTTRVTHEVSAKGRLVWAADGTIPTPAWQLARSFCQGKLRLGWTAVGDANFSPLSGQQLADQSAKQPLSDLAWNYVVEETLDELQGTYRVVETWLLNAADFYEEYQLATRRVADQPNLTTIVTVAGKVSGFYADLNDYDARYANAQAAWATIRGQLQARAATAAGITLNPHPSEWQVEGDPVSGTVSYTAAYDNRTLTNDTWEQYQVTKARSIEDFKTTVTVAGQITGVLYMDTDTDPAVRYTRAKARWDAVKGLLFARAVAESGLADLQAYPVRAQVEDRPAEGVVSYSYDFDNRPILDVIERITVSSRSSREDPRTTITVSGEIVGVANATTDDIFDPADPLLRYQKAWSYFEGIEPNLLGVAALQGGISTAAIWPIAWSKSVSQDPLGGKVSFEYSFTSTIVCFPGALSEVLTVVDEAAVPVIAEVPVLGRAKGPVVQDMGTVTSNRRTFTIELVFPLPVACGYRPPPAVDVTPYQPTGSVVRKTQDQASWSWNMGRYSRTVTWLWQP